MNTATKKTTTAAAAAALLTGTGLVAASVPAEAAAPAAQPAAGVAVQTAALPRAKGTSTAVIVYRSGTVAAKASISAAPQMTMTKKKAKKKYKSRRS